MHEFSRCLVLGVLGFFLVSGVRAHSRVEPGEVDPGGFARLTFWLFHGCDTAPTVRYSLGIPTGLAVTTPQVKAGWTIEAKTASYPEPVSVFGSPIEEGFTEIVWSGGPIRAEFMDSFVLTAYFPDRPGEVFRFLASQYCEGVEEPEESVLEVQTRAASETEDAPATQLPPETTAPPSWYSGASMMLAAAALILSLAAMMRVSRSKGPPS